MTYKIDILSTFVQPPLFLMCNPKMAFGSQVQEVDKVSKQPKWEAHFVAMSPGFGGGVPSAEVIKVGFISATNPSDGIELNSPVVIEGLEIGVMAKTVKDKTTGEERQVGVHVWHRAESMHPYAQGAGKAPAAQQKAA